ncbi:hypothetical protein Ddye_019159 [Dipteronia dyeriana]|uniref:Uncharacterized protein n=1 Tax=Dipteronia dyeriana TaxID=168575 RepID=A0AAD9WU62_9ROSI|nr:hypothetical protein Ddye_019159 [Dipteronia dyeriana]
MPGKKLMLLWKTGHLQIMALNFVDSVIGGQISSTVCCVECGHSSTLREPFLDLSLSVPTKKPPPKKVQPNSRAKKAKLPPKKTGKSRPKLNKNPDTVTAQSISNSSARAESAGPLNEQMVSSSGDSSKSCSVGPATMAAQSGSASQNVSAVPQSESEQVSENSVVASLDDMSWLDFLEPQTISDDHNTTLQSNDLLFQDSGDKDKVSDDILLESNQIPSLDEESNKKLDASSVNSWEDELPSIAQRFRSYLASRP